MDGSNSMVNELFQTNSSDSCFDYEKCFFPFKPCDKVHDDTRYSDASASWVLISAIVVFFMKAGFLLVELAFAQNVREKRHVVVVKHLDVFASAFGFFLFGYDYISSYASPQGIEPHFFKITDPVLWFFKFTFASNAATIVGGCLVTNEYKLRLPAAFLSSFIISGVIHPIVAKLIWSDDKSSFSVYRFCSNNKTANSCDTTLPFQDRMYILDFAGGGAVHIVGGVAGLVLCLFAKLNSFCANRKNQAKMQQRIINGGSESAQLVAREQRETVSRSNFRNWLYPVDGGGESTSEAALGVLILWFCWFAFNCGSTESIESHISSKSNFPYHAIPSIIAINMILAASSGGILSVFIASWAQMSSQSDSVNANEIANGILSSLVAITAGCPFVDFWAACLIGVVAVVVYHIGCWLEYKLGIEDTARVVPVHGLCGLWSLIAVGLLVGDTQSQCNLHATFEGLCYCYFRLPHFNYGERFAAQLIGALIMIAITASICFVMYGVLFLIPLRSQLSSETKFADSYNGFMLWLLKHKVKFDGNCLFTGPNEIPHPGELQGMMPPCRDISATNLADTPNLVMRNHTYGSTEENFGTIEPEDPSFSAAVNSEPRQSSRSTASGLVFLPDD